VRHALPMRLAFQTLSEPRNALPLSYTLLSFWIQQRNVPNIGNGHAFFVAVVDDVVAAIARIDGFAVFITLTALENLVNIRRGRVVTEKLVVLVGVGLGVKENSLM